MSSDNCTVCESPTAKSFHFGAKACKACAAFFRRAVALNVVYTCKSTEKCLVHYEKRFICKKCRFERCLDVGMKKHLVQPRRRLDTPEQEPVEYNEGQSSSVCSSISLDMEENHIVNLYSRAEMGMNDRRKLMYTNTRLRNLLGFKCEVPFERHDLRLFDFRAYNGCSRAEFAMNLDYIKAFPEFESLPQQDQNILYRCTTALDYIMNMAYYSHKLGMNEKIIVNPDCTYYPMDPPPLTGREPNAFQYFKSKEEFEKYKSLVPAMYENWHQLVLPMHRLNPTFEEFVLLKALTCWHMAYYKFMDEGRLICERQRNLIHKALFFVARSKQDGQDEVERVGELMLFMSTVLEQAYNLVTTMYMMTFFDILDCDPLLKDLLDQSPFAQLQMPTATLPAVELTIPSSAW